MSALTITYADHNTTDFDDLPVVTRSYVATIDGRLTGMGVSCPTSADDTVMRQALRDLLTAKGYTWTTET